tara:strand:+ start:654 stop:974 length:321 start_codon:yes stop_codon:yes gene_type:complete
VHEALLAVVVAAPREGANGTFIFFLNMIAIVFIFYFILIRPQRKEAKRHQEMIQNIRTGDEVVTTGGIVGEVIRADPDRLIIRTAGESKIDVERNRVSRKIEFGEK